MTASAALLGLLAVALGAFGAHGLEGHLSETEKGWWETGTFYALAHAVAALAISLSDRRRSLGPAAWMFLAGAGLFSATLYAMAIGAPRVLGAVTPVGGVGMIAGWALIGYKSLRRPPAF